MIKPYQREFIEFLLSNQVLKFGEFTLKSGRLSPYFLNLGEFKDGKSLSTLGHYYAEAIVHHQIKFDLLFGPAYKGIPLATATAIALANDFNKNIPYAFNRKEVKTHGDKGLTVGAPVKGKVLVIDDVITAGTTSREMIQLMQDLKADFSAMIIAFDRQERGENTQSAVQELTEKHGIPVYSIVNLSLLIEYLKTEPNIATHLEKILDYQKKWGVR